MRHPIPPDVIRRFHIALPQVREWIDRYLAAHANRARPVSTCGFARLEACYPSELLARAKVVSVDRVAFPPAEQFGLPELAAAVQDIPLDGITFKDTFFVRTDGASEVLHFHELIHVVQWARLGVDNFLLAYGYGLASFGYSDSPLEQMAYTLQDRFERGILPADLVRSIEQATDAVWNQVAPIARILQ